jgi:rhodanese-related sulfurtransferase
MVQVITCQELQARLAAAKPPIVLEALPEKYYRQGHLPGALHMPHDQVDSLAPGMLPDKSAQIVVYCANAQCQNSHIAAHRLSVLGYTNVSVYAGGKKDWEEAGLPLESLAEAA